MTLIEFYLRAREIEQERQKNNRQVLFIYLKKT